MLPELATRVNLPERMDDPACCEATLLRTVEQFTSINRLVSRYRTILNQCVLNDMARDPERSYRLADLGAGGCDIDAWLLHEARRRNLRLRITALDADPRTVEYARSMRGHEPGLEIQSLDVLRQTLDEDVDFVFGNHFLHHLADEEVVHLLHSWGQITRWAMVFSDLLRARSWYLGYYLSSWVYRQSFAREDGLISIRRGFRPDELITLAERAGLGERARIETLVPGRVVLHLTWEEPNA